MHSKDRFWLLAMSTNKNAFYPPALKWNTSQLSFVLNNHALKHDLIRLGMLVAGPGLFYLYVSNYYKDYATGIARVAGPAVVGRGFRGMKRDMPWGNDCNLLGNAECHNEKGMWPESGRLFTFGTSL